MGESFYAYFIFLFSICLLLFLENHAFLSTTRVKIITFPLVKNKGAGFLQGRSKHSKYTSFHRSPLTTQNLETDFISTLKNSQNESDFVYSLRLAARHKITLSSVEVRSLLDIISYRIRKMDASNVAAVIWSIGTLRLPHISKVCHHLNSNFLC